MLSRREIEFIEYKWIGVQGGYLGDFSYRTHYEFYYEYCGIEDINPYKYEGTTRQRFEQILSEVQPSIKAKILRGVLKKYPPGSAPQRTTDRYERMIEFIARCEGGTPVAPVVPSITTEVVELALSDADTLLKKNRPVSAVDRVHTAFHGYLKAICDTKKISYEKDASITRLFKLLRQNFKGLKVKGEFADQTEKIQNSLAAIVDAINLLRNRGSLAHPNEDLLNPEDAMLCINAIRTLIQYLNSKLSPQGCVAKLPYNLTGNKAGSQGKIP